MTPGPATCPGYRFPAEIIGHAAWLYHVFGPGLREVELTGGTPRPPSASSGACWPA
jgi:hypothetical protein